MALWFNVGVILPFLPLHFQLSRQGSIPEPQTPWRSQVPSLLDHPQWWPFLQQPIFTAAWVKDVCATTLQCPLFCTELIHRLLLIQSKVKVQVLHSSFFWKNGTILQLLHPSPQWCNEGFPCFTQFKPCRVHCGGYHRFLPISLQTLTKHWVGPISADFGLFTHLYKGINDF